MQTYDLLLVTSINAVILTSTRMLLNYDGDRELDGLLHLSVPSFPLRSNEP